MNSDHQTLWLALLNNRDIRNKYVVELRNRFVTQQEKTGKGTPNDEYENFVNAHLEAAAKCIPTKPRTKYRVPWETVAVREKRALVKTASKSYRKNPVQHFRHYATGTSSSLDTG